MQYVVRVDKHTDFDGSKNQVPFFKIGMLECDNLVEAADISDRMTYGPFVATVMLRIYLGGRSVLLDPADMRTISEAYAAMNREHPEAVSEQTRRAVTFKRKPREA